MFYTSVGLYNLMYQTCRRLCMDSICLFTEFYFPDSVNVMATTMDSQGFKKVFNVIGGIHEYAVKADPSIPTY